MKPICESSNISLSLSLRGETGMPSCFSKSPWHANSSTSNSAHFEETKKGRAYRFGKKKRVSGSIQYSDIPYQHTTLLISAHLIIALHISKRSCSSSATAVVADVSCNRVACSLILMTYSLCRDISVAKMLVITVLRKAINDQQETRMALMVSNPSSLFENADIP